ncbi:MAG TPA: M56 family metallopeptidase [Allosphingosinicella sp.]|nr:M56 family metallopeptidase [Allosphingosinicella sp.]
MIGWFFGNLAWASVVILLVLLVRRPVARCFGAGVAYALWLLPAARMLMPPQAWLAGELPSLLPPLDLVVLAGGSAAPLPSSGGPGQWVPLLLAIWAGGAAAFFVWQGLGYRRFLTRLSLASRSLGGLEGVPLVESAIVSGPLALGLLDRRIVVPADFGTRYSPEERRLALAHELVHHRRGDIWCNHLALLFLGFNWFNPIAWIAFRAFRADQELACDFAVSAAATDQSRQDYARALIKSASPNGLIAACPLNHADQLKRRLKMMKDHRRSRLRLLGGIAAVATLAGVSLTFGTPGIAHPHPEGAEDGERRQRIVILETKGGDHARAGEHAKHVLRIHRRGENGEIVVPESCREDNELVNVDEGSADQRTRIMICGDGEGDSASRLEHLERARQRLAENDELSAEHRQRVLEAMDRAIARVRAQ